MINILTYNSWLELYDVLLWDAILSLLLNFLTNAKKTIFILHSYFLRLLQQWWWLWMALQALWSWLHEDMQESLWKLFQSHLPRGRYSLNTSQYLALKITAFHKTIGISTSSLIISNHHFSHMFQFKRLWLNRLWVIVHYCFLFTYTSTNWTQMFLQGATHSVLNPSPFLMKIAWSVCPGSSVAAMMTKETITTWVTRLSQRIVIIGMSHHGESSLSNKTM